MKIVLSATSALFAVVAQALAAETLENDALRICFEDAADGFNVAAIENCLVGDTRFVNPAPGKGGFWRLDFVRKDADGKDEHVFVNNLASAVSRNIERTAKGLRFTWRGVDIADEKCVLDVTAIVDLLPGGAASEWRISVDNRSRRHALFQTSYPILGRVTEMGKGDALISTGNLGAALRKDYRYWDDDKKDREAFMPSGRPPLTAFNIGDAGLYIAAHDPELRFKSLTIQADHGVRFDTVVEDAGIVGKAAEGPRYAVTVAAYRGDWWQAAKLYRAWALKQKWAAKGPIARRTDYPKELAQTDLLFRFNEKNPEAMSNNVVALKRIFPNLKLSVHWYLWTTQPWCVNFPEFFPALPRVKETVAFAKSQGVTIAPYVDPRLWDVDLASWAYAKRDACRDMNGSLSHEIYYPKHKLAVMCPSSEAWQEVTMKMTTDAIMAPGECINGCGFDGIYHDQVACSRPIPCWAANHAHSKGGGTWWAEGYRKAFSAIHDWCSRRGAYILSEGTGDMCLDSIDGYLKGGGIRRDEVPFYPAVYSGRAIYYGCIESLKDSPAAFRAYQMRDFTCGVLQGWLDRWNVTLPEFAEHQKCLRTCARVRRAAEEFMVYGTLEDEVRFVGTVPEEKFTYHSVWRTYDYHWTMPLVIGNVWKNLSGTATAIVVANASDKRQAVRFRLPIRGFAPQHVSGVADAEYIEDGGVGILDMPPATATWLKAGE